MSALQRLAIAYLAVVLLAGGWAGVVDASLLHSTHEHLLPGVVLDALTLPSSLSTGALFDAWPEFFSSPLVQVAWAVLCGVFQAALLFVFGSRRPVAEA